ncbi:MAG: DUF433 domain-containing protein [Tepidisphaerales bacterium]
MSTVTEYPHLQTLANGDALIIGANTKVSQVAADRLAHGWDADQIHGQYPDLTLGQIHVALGYYYDHEDQINELIAQSEERADALLAAHANTALMAKLKAAREGK